MSGSLCRLIEQYSNLILAMEDDCNFDPKWLCFYRIQMTVWIMSRAGFCDNTAMAHETYEKIRTAWIDLSRYLESGKFTISNLGQLCATVDLGFADCNDSK